MSVLYDVAIIGGGLAGCSAAITLAEQGHRLALFESKHYPHHKVCGEFLSPECAGYFDELGMTPALRALQPPRVDTVAVIAPDGTRWETRLSRPGISVSRYWLDQALAERAQSLGADVHTGTTVTQITGSLQDTFSLEARTPSGTVQVRARVVIAAHGKRAGLDRALNRRFLHTAQPFTGLKAHFYGPPLPGRVDLYTFAGGYCGLGEVEGGVTNVCLLVRTHVFQRAGTIESFVAWMQTQNPGLAAWFAEAKQATERWQSISQVPFLRKTAVEGDILLAGDSAGLIAPLTGDGMSMALRGGQMAAQHVNRFLRGELTGAELRQHYMVAWEGAFGKRLWLGRALQGCMFQPRLLSLGLRALNGMPAIGRYLVAQTRDRTYLTHEDDQGRRYRIEEDRLSGMRSR